MDLEREIRTRFLDHLDDPRRWQCVPREFHGVRLLPYFVSAFEKEQIPSRRACLVRIIWEFRDRSALPTLAIALGDSSDEVWKDAVDGIVVLGGEKALAILKEARAATPATQAEKLEWIDEAIGQVITGEATGTPLSEDSKE